jgi:2-C-methyl-D-erythritol 2,4-cyclodiphosphate synthase
LKTPFRTGFAFDVHPFAENRKLILGGVEITHSKGLKGHSDADALIHAICDAMLGALALGDIGHYFPDTDMNFKDKESSFFLAKVCQSVSEQGYEIGNIDSMIALEKPKIAPHVQQMRKNIAGWCGCDIDQVSIKASTTEKLGFVGREEGITAYASVLLIRKNK